MVDIDETIVNNTIEKLFGVITILIEGFGGAVLDQIGNLITGRFNNSVGVLIIVGSISITAYMVVRRAQTG